MSSCRYHRYGDDDGRCQAREFGAGDILTRPVDFDHLMAQLRQLPSAGT
jgi:hypothetical protein